MQIIVSYDQDQNALPTGLTAAVDYVVNLFDARFTDNVTLNIHFGYGEYYDYGLKQAHPFNSLQGLGHSSEPAWISDYADVKTALTTLNALGASTLPNASPFGAGDLVLTNADVKALNLPSPGATSDGLDGSVGFVTDVNWSFATDTTPADGQYYFVGALEHEITEVMGRNSGLDQSGRYDLLDLYRYSGNGQRQLGKGDPSYFSVDGGKTNRDNFNNPVTGDTGDLGDWAPTAGNDSFLDRSPPAAINGLSSADVAVMRALGWTVADTLPVVTPLSGNVTAKRGQTFTATKLFTAADPDGDAVTTYHMRNSGNGRWLLNGAPLPLNQDITVTAAQLGQLTYKAGSGGDTLEISASDDGATSAPPAPSPSAGRRTMRPFSRRRMSTPRRARRSRQRTCSPRPILTATTLRNTATHRRCRRRPLVKGWRRTGDQRRPRGSRRGPLEIPLQVRLRSG